MAMYATSRQRGRRGRGIADDPRTRARRRNPSLTSRHDSSCMVRIGQYTLHTVQAGYFALDGGAMFGIVPKALWEKQIEPDSRNRIRLGTRCLLLESSDHLVLVDNGIGDKEDRRFLDIYGVDFAAAELHRSLHEVGFDARDITDVILTHLHFDHCGGTSQRKGDRLVMAFPNAKHYVQRAHWEWASQSNDREQASFLPQNLDPLAASGQLEMIDGATEVLPGISVLPVNGHTEAQQLVGVSGPQGTLVYVADLIPTAAHARPVWGMAYDIRPLVTIDEKKAFLDQAARLDWTLFFEHDARVEIASVTETERGFQLKAERPLADF